MIIWGCGTRKIGEKPLRGVCKVCAHEELNVVAYQTIFDLFFIPIFPLKKQYQIY